MSDLEYDRMSPEQMEFAVFCIGCVADELKLSPTRVYDILKENSVLQNYIVEFYDVLHTQSREYIVEDIINLMKEKNLI